MIKRYLEAGKIIGTHGIKGEIKVFPMCDSAEMLCEMETLYLKKRGNDNETFEAVKVEKARVQKGVSLLKLSIIETPEQAVPYKGQILFLDREDIELEEGCYFQADLLGIEVLDADTGALYGKLTDILSVSSGFGQDIYEITGEDGVKHLIPAVPEMIISTDVGAGEMTVRPIPGIFTD